MKVIEIKPDEFEKMVIELKKCREDKEKLEVANKYLNEQITAYNDKFAKQNLNDENKK